MLNELKKLAQKKEDAIERFQEGKKKVMVKENRIMMV
ncbi:unnamed protein product [Paramecium octaurelia]|uniref:Uncharacterized protein n=1 Tax=Paramecium octaurelia TaxID=43137 RepID=A0A8S1YGA6_PAROT|nr:unnamed protein product [Paramecium octaurelia]